MVNARFQRSLAQMGRKEFLETVKAAQKTRPEGMKVPEAALVAPSQWKPARDLPFTAGDRVQIISGQHKNKIGQILYKYPFGNAFAVNGISGEKVVNSIETKLQVGADDYEPVSELPQVFAYENLRLVSTLKSEAGDEMDVAIHSLSLGHEQYDPASNTHKRVRYATHDSSIQIPWPLIRAQRVAEEKRGLTTDPEVADTRTHYLISAVDAPLPMAAIPQITNLNNRFKRSRYAPRVSEQQAAKYRAPEMPLAPQTRKLLAELEKLPKPEPMEWTPEIQAFIGEEIKKGLALRVSKEKEALKQYT